MADKTNNILSILPRECEGGDNDGNFKRSVLTGDVLTATLSKLNNASLIKLLGELSEAINTCCQDDKGGTIDVTTQQWYIDIITSIRNIQTSITTIQATWNTQITQINESLTVVFNQAIDVKISEVKKIINQSITNINESITSISSVINNFFDSKTDVKVTLTQIITSITDIKVDVENIHKTLVVYEENFKSINVQITDIYAKLEIISKTTDKELRAIVDIHETRIRELETQIKLFEVGFPDKEKLVAVFIEILQNTTYVTQIFNSLKITINNSSKTLVEILEILARAEYVREVKLIYNDTDIIGATYILTDGCVYNFKARYQNLEGNLFKYIFEANWNGLPATFTSTFRETTTKWTVCKKEVSFTSYEPVSNTNIEFSLFPTR